MSGEIMKPGRPWARPDLADRIRGPDVTEVTVPQQSPAYATLGD